MQIVEPSATIEGIVDGRAILDCIERDGRTCYKSEDKITEGSSREFVRMIIKRGHESVLEHVSVSVRFICDRGVSHEIVRHRIASYSQESTRYCNYGKAGGIQVIIPTRSLSDAQYESVEKLWSKSVKASERAYLKMIELGVSPQIARSVLPTCLKTELVMTANLREWRHFFKLRTAKAAHPQMREVAICAFDRMKAMIPVVFDDIQVEA